MKKYQKGQILLAVILIMVVALTVGLSVAVRTTTNIRTSTEEENSQRAFSAAEAGIEQALVNSSVTPSPLSNNTSYSTSVNPMFGVGVGGFLANNGAAILKDEPVDVWLSDYSADPTQIYLNPWSGNLTVNWGASSDSCSSSEINNSMAALEIVIISGSKASPKVAHYAFDPCAARAGSNKFNSPTNGGNTVNGQVFAYKATINIPPASPGLIARIIPLYAPTLIGIEGDTALPKQGSVVTSTGTSDNTKRQIISFQGYPQLPTELFPFIVFSPK